MQVVVFKHNYMNINNKDIIQSYIMTTAKYDFSADEKRILLRLVETWQHLLEGKELNGKIGIPNSSFWPSLLIPRML